MKKLNHSKFKHLIILSQENLELSALEAREFLELDDSKTVVLKNIILTEISKKNLEKISRLAFSKKVLKILFIEKNTNTAINDKFDIEKFIKKIELFNFSKFYDTNFCLRIHNYSNNENHSNNEQFINNNSSFFTEPELSKPIWRSLDGRGITPEVNLKFPKTLFEIIILDNEIFFTKNIFENSENFEIRKAHYKPELHPTAMHPKMARGLINILNRKKILDPFCGAGGIITEAALMNVKATGYDIDNAMINRAKINLNNYNISKKNYQLIKKNCLDEKSFENLVTDLPYGKSSKKSDDLMILYVEFFKKISGRAIVVMPDFVDYKKVIKNLPKKLVVKKLIKHYVHKSLTRIILLIDFKKI